MDSNNSIYEGNALRIDWNDIVKPYELNYIMGNPPFIGKKEQTSSQKEDLKTIFDNQRIGTLDYVTGWYKKAADYIKGHSIRVAFVSTNSITQGEQVVRLWTLLKNYDLTINFAYRTFVWNNEAKHKAHVHVVIIGFSNKDFATDTKDIFTDNDSIITATTINPYLLDAPTVLIKSRSKPISSVEPMNYGSMPIDDGNLILSSEEKDHLLSNDPLLKKFIRPYYGGREILHSTPRYCLWLVGITPADLRSHPSIIKYIDATREFREASHRPGTLKAAERPAEFGEIRQPKSGQVIVLPKVSSERRKYIPIEYMDSKNIINGSALMIQNANLYMFGVLNSVVHNAWMRVVAGRMKSDYQYSAKIVYNNFPWPEIDNRQKDAIAKTAQGIISARKDDPDATLAELYAPKNFENIEIDLRKAHEANDKAVLKAYGLKPLVTELEIVQHLFRMYEQLTSSE